MQMTGLAPCLPLCHMQACSLERRIGVEKASSVSSWWLKWMILDDLLWLRCCELTSPAAPNVCNKMSTTRTQVVPTRQGNVHGGVPDRRSA